MGFFLKKHPMSCDLKSSFLPGFTNAKKNANFSALSFEFVDFPHEITETNWLFIWSIPSLYQCCHSVASTASMI